MKFSGGNKYVIHICSQDMWRVITQLNLCGIWGGIHGTCSKYDMGVWWDTRIHNADDYWLSCDLMIWCISLQDRHGTTREVAKAHTKFGRTEDTPTVVIRLWFHLLNLKIMLIWLKLVVFVIRWMLLNASFVIAPHLNGPPFMDLLNRMEDFL